MYRLQVLIGFSFAMILSGIAMLWPTAHWGVLRLDDPRFSNPSGCTLILLGAIGGLLSLRHFRQCANAMGTALTRQSIETASTPLVATDGLLQPLARSINSRVTVLGQQLEQAAQRTRELEIQLKVVGLEREHAHSIIYSISDAVLVTDPWDELVLANESARRVLGIALPEQGRSPIDTAVKDARLVKLIREMRASRSTGTRRTVEHRTKVGDEERTYKVTLSAVGPLRAEGTGVVAVMQDTTREAEVAAMKNDFVSHVSHELRTPLASIKAYTEMLIDGEAVDDKQRNEFYEVIQNEANRLGRLIDNILDVSRIESGLHKINKVPLSLTVVIKEALEIITPQAAGKKITIRADIAPAMHQVIADRDMIHRVVLNLLSNAVKYTHEEGQITVRTDVDEAKKMISVHVSDTGVGIPPKDLPFVFDKFYRVEANSKMAKGTGLGLALVRHIIESVHKGKIEVTSTVGVGSEFSFQLELA